MGSAEQADARRTSGVASGPWWRRDRATYLFHALVATALLILFAIPIDGDRASAVEVDVFRFLNGFPDFLDPPIWVAMQFGNLLAAPAAALVALVLRRWRLALSFVLAGVGKWIFSAVVKDIVVRHRPAAVLDDVIIRDEFGSGQAFVSGHVVIAVSLATLAHPYLGRRGRVLVWTLAGLVCFGRVYVGAHLPLDVMGGAALGWAIGSAILLLVGVSRSQRGTRGT